MVWEKGQYQNVGDLEVLSSEQTYIYQRKGQTSSTVVLLVLLQTQQRVVGMCLHL